MNTRKRRCLFSIAVVALGVFVLILVGCGGGGGEAVAPSSSFVSGVAAAGAPIIGNANLKDSANQIIGPVPIGADGSFLFNVTGLTPPFYLRAEGYVGSPDNRYSLFSATISNGTANINPLTNLIVAAAAGGIDPASVYGDPASHPITQITLATATTELQVMLQPLLADYQAENVNPISDSFTADHTKLDKVFDLTAFTVESSGSAAPRVVVTDNSTGQKISEASTGNLKNPTMPLPSQENFPLADKIIKGANRLVETQNNDGGWEWDNPDINPATGVPSPNNTLGVTVQGLLDAYRISKNSGYLNACIKTYHQMVINAADAGPDPQKHRIRAPDITFLVELSEVTGNPSYAAFAKDRYEAALLEFGGNTASGFAEFIRSRRLGLPALISWDINLYIQGALSLDRYYAGQGFSADAKAMTEVIYRSFYVAPVDFNVSGSSQIPYYWLAYSGAIEAFTTTGQHSDNRDALKLALVASQQADGHIPEYDGDTVFQTTAYAVMALLKAGENEAAGKGVKFLVNTQSVNGGWLENNTEFTECDSEAIQAIYDYKK